MPFHLKSWKWLRLAVLMLSDAALIGGAYLCAYYLRLDSILNNQYTHTAFVTLPVYVACFLVAFYIGGMYRQVWRFANYNSAVLIGKCVTAGMALAVVAVYFVPLLHRPPRSVPIITWLISIVTVAFSRFAWRPLAQYRLDATSRAKDRCLIYGAGAAGDLLARHVVADPRFPYRVVGFIDDDRNKRRRLIHGMRILGSGDDLEEICTQHRVKAVLLAMPSVSGKVVRTAVARCHEAGVKPLIMPDMTNSLGSEVIRPRPVDLADLLRRPPQGLGHESVQNYIRGRVVLITGAGGSIGSEIVRQVVACMPARVILYDASEFNLYKIHAEIEENSVTSKNGIDLKAVLGSTTNRKLVDDTFAKYRPELVLHAAAYKHVPLLESNPTEAIVNNILGTQVVGEAAIKHGTSRFLLISTDKAVRPTNVMGATKRVCELVVQSLQATQAARGRDERNSCVFCAVRFGNVLGSSGSVVPRFIEQIQKGGPITVTHPDVTRFFMLTAEAVGLVLQAATLAKGGEIFVLNMGEPVRIVDMAEELIRLAGKEPGKDVEIVFTGLRPGEKLYEELILEGAERRVDHDNLFIATPNPVDPEQIFRVVGALIQSATLGDAEASTKLLRSLVHWMEPGRDGQAVGAKVPDAEAETTERGDVRLH